MAENEYNEALDIYRNLAVNNADVYSPDVAMTTVNLAIFYLQAKPDKEKSLSLAAEALVSAHPLVEILPAAQNYFNAALQIFAAWGEDVQAYLSKHNQAKV